MNRTSWKCLLVGTIVAITLWSVAPQADAQWWGCCRPAYYGCGYTPCYSSCWGCGYGCCDSGWYLGCRPGPIRRLLLGPYRWYRGGYCGGYCGYSCYSCSAGCVSYDTCCSDVVSGTPTLAQPAAPAPTPAKKPVAEPPAEMPSAPAPARAARSRRDAPSSVLPKSSATSADNSGILTVWVPYDAKVTINGLTTHSTGSRREFVSYGLRPGLSYKYVVNAQVIREGKLIEDTRTITLRAGAIEAVAFGFNVPPTEQVAFR